MTSKCTNDSCQNLVNGDDNQAPWFYALGCCPHCVGINMCPSCVRYETIECALGCGGTLAAYCYCCGPGPATLYACIAMLICYVLPGRKY